MNKLAKVLCVLIFTGTFFLCFGVVSHIINKNIKSIENNIVYVNKHIVKESNKLILNEKK